jgi:nucleoside-diphosphate-sugar epimerase
MSLRVLILGVNGFIGSHLLETILSQTHWRVIGLDISSSNIHAQLSHPNFEFYQRDLQQSMAWLDGIMANIDVVLPLVAIATPATYVQNPLRIFELDFETNIEVVRICVKHNKRVIFPSTSEVYGMCSDSEFDEHHSNLVCGPIHKQRWIYASCKQLLDRVIYAYGEKGELSYTLFRPFNWIGPRLDDINNPKPGGARVITQFLGQIMRGENLQLVDGGQARRCFTAVEDGIAALMTIIKNENQCADKQIFNLGNPANNFSIKELAELLLEAARQSPAFQQAAKQVQLQIVSSQDYYGAGYQDVAARVPAIHHAQAILHWQPTITLPQMLQQIVSYYAQQVTRPSVLA